MLTLEQAQKIANEYIKFSKFNILDAIRETDSSFIFCFTDGIKAPGGQSICEINKVTHECKEFDFLNRLEYFYASKQIL